MDDRTVANVSRYRWHTRAVGAMFWLPTIVLYFIDEVGLARALQMQAVYYAAVVVLEVPSGWFSDRVGRVTTLRITAAAWIVAFACFLVGGLGPIVAGQVLLALGYASLSGTDVTFLFDTLDAAGQSHTFEREEAQAREGSLYLTALTALAGGALGMVDLRLPFVAALVVAIGQLGVTMRMDEPARRTTEPPPGGGATPSRSPGTSDRGCSGGSRCTWWPRWCSSISPRSSRRRSPRPRSTARPTIRPARR